MQEPRGIGIISSNDDEVGHINLRPNSTNNLDEFSIKETPLFITGVSSETLDGSFDLISEAKFSKLSFQTSETENKYPFYSLKESSGDVLSVNSYGEITKLYHVILLCVFLFRYLIDQCHFDFLFDIQ